MAQGFYSIFVLPSGRRRRPLHRQPVHFWHHPRPNNGAHLTNRSHQDIARAGGHVPGRNLRDYQSPDADEPHLQWHFRGIVNQPFRYSFASTWSSGMKDPTFNEAKQLYLEQYASAIVTPASLNITLTFFSLLVLSLSLMHFTSLLTLS